MATNTAPQHRTPGDRRWLGTLWIIYAVVHLAVAAFFVLYSSTATVMFGALLTRVPDPYLLMDTFHILYICAIVIAAVGGVLGLLAGIGLVSGKSSVRRLALAASFLCVADLPVGTTLGIYTLIVFLP